MVTRKQTISTTFIDTVCDRLVRNEPVRRRLPLWGRLHIDQKLPFLCVYRRPKEREDVGTAKLIQGESSYLMASGHRQIQKGLRSLVHGIAETLIDSFGAFMVLEIWSASEPVDAEALHSELRRPIFRVHTSKVPVSPSTVEVLKNALQKIRLGKKRSEVHVLPGGKVSPSGFGDLLSSQTGTLPGCVVIGLEVEPVYRDSENGQLYPLVIPRLHRQLARAFKKTFYEFSRSHTTLSPSHFLSLGRRTMVKAAWEVDRQLAEVSNAFDFLLYITPTNADSAWAAFKKKGCESVPAFAYSPLPVDPTLLKRQLYAIPIERIEGPVIAQLFREKQQELDRQISMLNDRGSRHFLWGSLQLYGGDDEATLETARDILGRIPPHSRDGSRGGYCNAEAFAQRAEDEIAYYRSIYPEVSSGVEVRGDVSGLLVSRNELLIGKSIKIPVARVEALIQHEVGTHLLTYINGRSQPFKQLYSGLAGYEELQEGLAVLAEYFAGGLNRSRLRLLAGRVVAVRCLIDGASFIETFRELNRKFGFEQHTAFMVTMRVFRSGGLAKDAIYLKGLLNLIQLLKEGQKLETLFVGKIGSAHIPIVEELQWRNVLHRPPLRPHYMADSSFSKKLDTLINTDSILEIVERKK